MAAKAARAKCSKCGETKGVGRNGIQANGVCKKCGGKKGASSTAVKAVEKVVHAGVVPKAQLRGINVFAAAGLKKDESPLMTWVRMKTHLKELRERHLEIEASAREDLAAFEKRNPDVRAELVAIAKEKSA